MKAYKAGEIPEVGNMYFVYGDGGMGKTSLAKQLPGKKLLLIFDGSTNALVGTNDIDVVSFGDEDAPRMQQLVTQMLSGSYESHDAIILDNVTALQNWVLENIDGASKDGRQNYQKLQVWFRNLGMWLRNTGKPVLATAHQLDSGPGGLTGEGRFQADMNEKTFNAFSAPFDIVGRIYKESDERWIDIDPENGNHAKNRIDNRKLVKANELILNSNTKKEEK